MPISEILQLAGQVEKLGIIGLMCVASGVMAWALVKYRKELARTYRQRDRCRLICVRYKGALDNANIVVNITDIEEMFKTDALEEMA